MNVTASDHQQDFDEKRFFRRGANKIGNSRWRTLDELSGSVVDIWTLGLSCRTVRRLVLHVGQYHEFSETAPSEMDLLADVLSDVRPEALELTFVSHWRRLDRCSASFYGAIHKAQRKIHWVKATIVLHPLPCTSIVRDAAGAVKRIMVSE